MQLEDPGSAALELIRGLNVTMTLRGSHIAYSLQNNATTASTLIYVIDGEDTPHQIVVTECCILVGMEQQLLLTTNVESYPNASQEIQVYS